MAITWESIAEGDALPELRKTPDVEQLVKYAAGSGDFNPLHYDYNFPQAKQIGSVIVHGRFKYAALGELVSNWLGHGGHVKKIACQYRGMDLPGREIVCRGTVKRKWQQDGEKLAELDIWAENPQGKKTTPGSAIVAFR
ncbi:MAG: MaoC/PaaZ C-terminal domain-containing protein [Candidatus Binatia bacterium]